LRTSDQQVTTCAYPSKNFEEIKIYIPILIDSIST
jgi:hypothetical protein